MYKNPIEVIYDELQTQMVQEDEKLVMKTVRNVGVNVDKGELIKALQYDRNQYTKGYEDGKNDVLDKIRAEIEAYNDTVFLPASGREAITLEALFQILDKYKAESEVEECR